MYRLTQRRKEKARDVLDRYTKELHDTRRVSVGGLEQELRNLWGIGYQTLKGIMIDMLSNHSEYVPLAAYYMEHSNASGVVSEFKRPLAQLYGIPWYHSDARESHRRQFWDTTFAVISHFDIDTEVDGQTIIQVSSLVNAQLVEYFLKHPADLCSMESRHFEELIAELFDGFGYVVELTAATRDNGRDVIAIGNHSVAESKFLIECKRYAESNKVGIQPVRSLHGVVTDEKATKGIIATTSRFTGPAIEFIDRNKWKLEGRDFDGVLEWLKAYQRMKHPLKANA